MKVSIKLQHTYMSGWKNYNLELLTEFPGMKTIKALSGPIVMKEEYSSKLFTEWAKDNGIDVTDLFTDPDKVKKDSAVLDKLTSLISTRNDANLKEMSTNKCYTKLSATRNTHFSPMKTAFETIFMYDVLVQVEYNDQYGQLTIPVPAREKNDAMPFIMGSGKNMGKVLYEEEEAMNYVSMQIDKLVDDCDTEEKFKKLLDKLNEIQRDAVKSLKK